MDLLEKNVINSLIDLKENYNILGVKAEFEDEGSDLEEIFRLKKFVSAANLSLTIKIGGCGALNDVNQTKLIGAETIVAPMIESSYALKKFVETVNAVYDENQIPKLFVNIETVSGYKNFDEIFSIPEKNQLTGIVVGRFDMAKSIDLSCKDCNGERIFNIVNELAVKTQKINKLFSIGGGVTNTSLSFFQKLSAPLNRFETRKIIFDASSNLENNNYNGIIRAIQFEIAWINLRRNLYGICQSKDSKRLEILESRCEKLTAGSI